MRPNPFIERTSSGELRLPAAAAHVKRWTARNSDRESKRFPQYPLIIINAVVPHESEPMKALKRILSIVVTSMLTALAVPASASNITGTIAYLRVDTYGHIWVALTNGPLLCVGGISEAYVLISDANYDALRTWLLASKTSRTSVQLNTTTNGGYCHLDSASFF